MMQITSGTLSILGLLLALILFLANQLLVTIRSTSKNKSYNKFLLRQFKTELIANKTRLENIINISEQAETGAFSVPLLPPDIFVFHKLIDYDLMLTIKDEEFRSKIMSVYSLLSYLEKDFYRWSEWFIEGHLNNDEIKLSFCEPYLNMIKLALTDIKITLEELKKYYPHTLYVVNALIKSPVI